jgi:DNA-directed RNA polymerase subunit RPC12/RpoP
MPTVVFAGLRLPEREGEKETPFTVRCHCGATLQGQRLAQHQVVRCSHCGAERFILPRSALPVVKAVAANPPSSVLRSGSWRVWRGPLIGAGLALVLGIVGIVLLVHFAVGPEGESKPLSPAQQAEQHLQAGENAIQGGSFHQAERELSAALDLSPQWPAAHRQEVTQLQRQAGILADLLTEAPAEIIRNSLGVPEAEWQAIFARNYAHRSIILDDTVHKDASGYHLGFKTRVAGAAAHWDLNQLSVLKSVDLFQPRRVILGLRLAEIRPDGKGGWLVIPEPDSGVLFTDPRFFVGLSVAVDREMEQVLKAQQEWVK